MWKKLNDWLNSLTFLEITFVAACALYFGTLIVAIAIGAYKTIFG